MAARYWVLGAGVWSDINTVNWSTTSGGTGGASVPTSADTPIFDANSGSGIVVFTNGGVTVGATTINNSGIELSLGAAFVTSGALTLTAGTFTTNGYNVSASALLSSNSNAREINLGNSTVTLTATTSIDFTNSTNLTFNAGTSQINLTRNTATTLVGGNKTFYNVSFTGTGGVVNSILDSNTFNNLTLRAPANPGLRTYSFDADQTINGTLTLSAGTNATMRTFVRSDTIGTTRTLTCAAVASLQDIDFRDIAIAGAAAPVSGTRLGDCKGNSGITFPAAAAKYWNLAAGNNWAGSVAWATSSGGTPDINNFPLAQDTAVFEATGLNSGAIITISAAYNIGTIDMSARTSNTMTLSCAQLPFIYGNWINGTGTAFSGTGTFNFAGRGSQTITSAGVTFTQAFTIDTPGGSVTLQDAFVSNRNATTAFTLTSGTFDANGYNFSLTGATSRFSSLGANSKTIAVGSGAWTIAGSATSWSIGSAATPTVTGTGTISLTSASAKTFAGGDVQTYPTLNQGSTGTLTFTGSNKFANITNTAIGRVQFTGGTTNEFTAFNLNGVSGNLLQVGSTNTTQVTLKAPSWNVGANSTDAGNNTGLTFSAGSVDYLSISYVNGEIVAGPTSSIYYGAANITAIYYGSTPVSAIYYGATQVY